jgi:hypothetical protein
MEASDMIISYNKLRKSIGWLGLLLPLVIIFGNWVFAYFDVLNCSALVDTNCGKPYFLSCYVKPTISDSYYTPMGEWFTGCLGSIGLFMFCYKGHTLRPGEHLSDNLLTNTIGICAFLVALCPTSASLPEGVNCLDDNFRIFQAGTVTNIVHLSAATLLFVCLGRMSYTNFRRSQNPEDFGKGADDGWFKFFGLVIYSCIGGLMLYKGLSAYVPQAIKNLQPFYILESIALISFGLSWLIKGKIDFMYWPKKLGLAG